jgi:hypothetical protein
VHYLGTDFFNKEPCQQKNPAVHLREMAGPEQRRGQSSRQKNRIRLSCSIDRACDDFSRAIVRTFWQISRLLSCLDDTSFMAGVQHSSKKSQKFLQDVVPPTFEEPAMGLPAPADRLAGRQPAPADQTSPSRQRPL